MTEMVDERKAELEQQLAWLIGQSRDRYFTEYLEDLRNRLRQDAVTAEYAAEEIARTSRLYSQRMAAFRQQEAVFGQQEAAAGENRSGSVESTVRPGMSSMARKAEENKKGSVEFTIGAGVLGILGVLFLLIAFVIMGITYMSGLVKGISLYVIAIAVLLFSELMLNRKMPKFAVAVTALGIGGLYLSTMLNYLYLQNFNGYVTMGATVLISLLAVFISRKRDSLTLKIISFTGCYIGLFPTGQSFLAYEKAAESSVKVTHFLVAAGVLFIVNLMTLFLPVKKNKNAANMLHMILNTCFSVAFAVTAFFRLDTCVPILWYLLGMILVQGLIFFVMAGKNKEDSMRDVWDITRDMAVYLCADIVLRFVVCLFYLLAAEQSGEAFLLRDMHLLTAGFFLAGLFVFFLFIKKDLKWLQYMLFTFQTLAVYGLLLLWIKTLYWWCLGVVLGLFLLSKVLSRVKTLKISELLVTLWTACVALYYFKEFHPLSALCVLGAFALSLAALHEWRSLYEEIFILLLECFVLFHFRNVLTPAIMVCILFLGVSGFNYIRFFRDKNTCIFNYINLGLMGSIYLAAAFFKDHYSYGALLLLGVTFILLMFHERFGMGFRFKHMILVLFVCYMVLIWELPISVFKSALLMVAAIAAIIAGFILKEKNLRITGLALTLAVCGKMVVYDFAAEDTMAKMLVFMIVGLIALIISGIYIALEKKIV